MYHKLVKWSGIIGITAMVLAIAGMLVYSWKKPLIYVRAEENEAQSHKTQTGQVDFEELTPTVREDADNLCIPVAAGVTQEAIHIDCDYMNHILTITIEGMGTSDLSDGVYGSLDGINRIQTAEWDGQLILMALMEDSYEYGAILENQRLMLTLKMPRELYDRIVVLDAGHGGADKGIEENGVTESELALDTAGRGRELLSDEGIRVYMTRTDRENPGGVE
ncbi:MAG: N-acetylmuramoyl-L-alanine amidase, partial [Lachnospiraceae bacterium]|nr:N-acetylmuramoyl-L-alanine amidase [Lachnospiraceae bacterium]